MISNSFHIYVQYTHLSPSDLQWIGLNAGLDDATQVPGCIGQPS